MAKKLTDWSPADVELAAEQAALNENVEPFHRGRPYKPKYAAVIAERSKFLVGALSARRPSWKQ